MNLLPLLAAEGGHGYSERMFQWVESKQDVTVLGSKWKDHQC